MPLFPFYDPPQKPPEKPEAPLPKPPPLKDLGQIKTEAWICRQLTNAGFEFEVAAKLSEEPGLDYRRAVYLLERNPDDLAWVLDQLLP